MQPDDSMALPSKELRASSDESAVEEDEEEDDMGTIVTEENPLPEEANDVLVDEAGQMEDNEVGFPPKVEEQNVNDVDPDALEVQEDETLSREPTLVESTALLQPVRVKVTFDDTSAANYDKSYDGPLISSEQLAFSGEDLTDILFCKHFNATVTGLESSASEVASKNYLECAESILEQGIRRCLASYNAQAVESGSGARIINLVTFREALQHAARLSRALVNVLLLFLYDVYTTHSHPETLKVIHQTRMTVFDHISKHREESCKYDAQRSIFNELRGVWNVVKHCLEYLIYLLNRN